MSRKESQQPSNQEPHLELPIPKEGLYLQIAAELLSNRSKFVSSSLDHMRRENPDLLNALILVGMAVPNRDLAIDWALTYYELNARPGRLDENSPQIVSVSMDTIEAMSSIEARELEELKTLDPSSPEAEEKRKQAMHVIQNIDAQDNLMHLEDSARSPEFALFWSAFHIIKARILMQEDHSQIEFTAEPLNLVVRSLHAQLRINRFRKTFPSS